MRGGVEARGTNVVDGLPGQGDYARGQAHQAPEYRGEQPSCRGRLVESPAIVDEELEHSREMASADLVEHVALRKAHVSEEEDTQPEDFVVHLDDRHSSLRGLVA